MRLTEQLAYQTAGDPDTVEIPLKPTQDIPSGRYGNASSPKLKSTAPPLATVVRDKVSPC